jgi:hypothetical protein
MSKDNNTLYLPGICKAAVDQERKGELQFLNQILEKVLIEDKHNPYVAKQGKNIQGLIVENTNQINLPLDENVLSLPSSKTFKESEKKLKDLITLINMSRSHVMNYLGSLPLTSSSSSSSTPTPAPARMIEKNKNDIKRRYRWIDEEDEEEEDENEEEEEEEEEKDYSSRSSRPEKVPEYFPLSSSTRGSGNFDVRNQNREEESVDPYLSSITSRSSYLR